MKPLVKNILLISLAGSVLSACNSGSATPSSVAPKSLPPAIQKMTQESQNKILSKTISVQSPLFLAPALITGASMDEIEKWWNNKQATGVADAKAKKSLFQSLYQNKLGLYLSNTASNLFDQGYAFGLAYIQKTILNMIFPPQKSVDQIRYENIMASLERIETNVENVKLNTRNLFSLISDNYVKDKYAIFKTMVSGVNQIDGNVGAVFNSIDEFKGAYKAGKLDFMTPDAKNPSQLILNESMTKFVMFAADNKLFDHIFTDNNAAVLEGYANSFANVNSQDAYAGISKALLSNSNLSDVNNQIMPLLMLAMSNSIVADYQNAFENGSNPNHKIYKYKDTQYSVDSQYNQLYAYLDFDKALTAVLASSLNQLSIIERLQYLSLALRYIGGDKQVSVPSIIYSTMLIKEKQADELEKTNPDKAAEIREAIFNDSIKMLDAAYQTRASKLNKLISTPNKDTYGKLTLQSTYETKRVTTAFDMGQKAFVPVGWDLIRGNGVFNKTDSSNKARATVDIPNRADDDFKVYYNVDGISISLDEMAAKNFIYWDGYYMKTLVSDPASNNQIKNIPIMQNIGDRCNPEAGTYLLHSTNYTDDSFKSFQQHKLLSCADKTLKFDNVIVGSNIERPYPGRTMRLAYPVSQKLNRAMKGVSEPNAGNIDVRFNWETILNTGNQLSDEPTSNDNGAIYFRPSIMVPYTQQSVDMFSNPTVGSIQLQAEYWSKPQGPNHYISYNMYSIYPEDQRPTTLINEINLNKYSQYKEFYKPFELNSFGTLVMRVRYEADGKPVVGFGTFKNDFITDSSAKQLNNTGSYMYQTAPFNGSNSYIGAYNWGNLVYVAPKLPRYDFPAEKVGNQAKTFAKALWINDKYIPN